MRAFRLRFPIDEIPRWASAYTNSEQDDAPIEHGKAARRRGFLTRDEFVVIAGWKSRRPAQRHESNSDEQVRDVTRFAFSTGVESLRLEALTLLSGVQARTASAILHLCHRDPYPLMDVNAFWSLDVEEAPSDWTALWPEYVRECRAIAKAAGVDMRTLDRALWGYADVNQGSASARPAT